MSTRSVFTDTKVEYLLPPLAGSSVGDVVAVTSAVNGLSLGFQAGGDDGLNVDDVYSAGVSYTLPAIAGAQQAGKVLTAIGGQCVLTADSGLDVATVYGTGDPYVLPILATASNNQVAKVIGGELQFAAAPVPLSQEQLYGNGAPYKLPAVQGEAGKIMTVAGGELQFSAYTGLQANQVWPAGPQYRLPAITGAPIGAELVSSGGNALVFRLNPSVVLGVTLYGGESVSETNDPFVLPPVGTAVENTVFTKQGTEVAWVAQDAGVQANEVWVNTAVTAKIPDYTGSAANTMFAVNPANGATSWDAAPNSIAFGDLWAAPAPDPTDNYKLPAIGAPAQALTVSGTPNVLEYAPVSFLGTSTVTATFSSQFAAASTPQTIVLSKTGKMVIATLTSDSTMVVQNANNVFAFTMVPGNLQEIAAFLPPDNTAHVFGLGSIIVATSDETTFNQCMIQLNPLSGVFTFTSTLAFPPQSEWLPGPASEAAAYLGSWVTA